MNTAFIFPGQGAQHVGMAAEFMAHPQTAPLFEQANAILGFNLKELMLSGPEEQLTLTENTQPALLLAGVAAWRLLCAESEKSARQLATFVAGHSLGEYTALVAADVLDFEDALQLVRKRGQFMQAAVPAGQGAMAAVLGLSIPALEAICAEAGVWIANDNADGQVVISGATAAIDAACAAATEAGAKRALKLNVSAPFHCPMVQPAADAMAEELEQVTFRTAKVPVVLNVTAAPEVDGDTIRQMLVRQITGRVRWREIMAFMGQSGVHTYYEMGAGKVLCGLAKRVGDGIERSATALNSPADIAAYINKE